MTTLALDVRELNDAEIDQIAGGPVPLAVGVAVRAGVGGLIGGGAAFAAASGDGQITRQEVATIGAAVVGGALTGAFGGLAGRFL